MMLNRIVLNRPQKQPGESPFWISFADLMTALMALFLMVMAVTLISVTRDVSSAEERKIQREKEIQELMATIREKSRVFPEVTVDESSYRIDLGEKVRFDSNRSDISQGGSRFLRGYVPILLKVQASVLGRKWIRRIVVEGFTDQDGTYLLNLALSLQRSRSVVCVMFDPPAAGETSLTGGEKRQIEDLFLVGGYSFNSMKASKEASRRVELKVDFWALEELKEPPAVIDNRAIGQC
jgi:outer membrane protein OmpA-like peptidoglycan-associated protein